MGSEWRCTDKKEDAKDMRHAPFLKCCCGVFTMASAYLVSSVLTKSTFITVQPCKEARHTARWQSSSVHMAMKNKNFKPDDHFTYLFYFLADKSMGLIDPE